MAKKRQKLCYHCEGEVDLDVIVCPFCAADLRAEKPDTLRSFTPPMQKTAVEEAVAEPEEGQDKWASLLHPTVLFAIGIQLVLFGLIMLLFSHRGVMIMKWDARLWFLYLFGSIPFLVFGYKSLSKL